MGKDCLTNLRRGHGRLMWLGVGIWALAPAEARRSNAMAIAVRVVAQLGHQTGAWRH